MTDTLRTRIAAVLWTELQRQSQEKPEDALYVADADARYESGEVGLIDGHVNVSELADAVIRELRLHVVTVGDFKTVIKGSYPKPLEDK